MPRCLYSNFLPFFREFFYPSKIFTLFTANFGIVFFSFKVILHVLINLSNSSHYCMLSPVVCIAFTMPLSWLGRPAINRYEWH